MSQAASVPPVVNKIMKLILRSPIHGLVSKTVLLITFAGRKSGKSYTTPVSYSQVGDRVTIFTHAAWWKNLTPSRPVTLSIQGRKYQGIAEPISKDKQAIAAALVDHLRAVPSDARWYGVTLDEQGNPEIGEVEKAVQTVVMLRVWLC